jgi:Na+-driven multidrug efflux pump
MAAYTVTMRIEQLVQQPYGSLGMALTSYAGQNFGAQRIDRVKKGMHRATFMVLIFSLIMIPVFYVFGKQIIYCFVKEPEVISIGAKALRITSLFYFFLGMIYAPRSLLNGCGDTTFSMINGITEVVCRISFSILFTSIATISIFGHTYNIGYWGIWLTTGLTWFTTAMICLLRYKLGSWRTKTIVK